MGNWKLLVEAALSHPDDHEDLDSEFAAAHLGLRGTGKQLVPST